jgi:hypothetical protein
VPDDWKHPTAGKNIFDFKEVPYVHYGTPGHWFLIKTNKKKTP